MFLSCSQVEFESIKLELTQKNDEQEEMRAQMDEAVRLKEITERQLDEALEALKEEREQKNSLRRELSALTLNPFDSVGNLELHLEQLDDSQEEGQGREGGEGEGEDQDSGINNGSGSAPGSAHPPHLGGSKSNGLIRRYSTPRNSDVFLRAPASGLVSDLLSELHFSDSQKLKQQLLQVGNRSQTCHRVKLHTEYDDTWFCGLSVSADITRLAALSEFSKTEIIMCSSLSCDQETALGKGWMNVSFSFDCFASLLWCCFFSKICFCSH